MDEMNEWTKHFQTTQQQQKEMSDVRVVRGHISAHSESQWVHSDDLNQYTIQRHTHVSKKFL